MVSSDVADEREAVIIADWFSDIELLLTVRETVCAFPQKEMNNKDVEIKRYSKFIVFRNKF